MRSCRCEAWSPAAPAPCSIRRTRSCAFPKASSLSTRARSFPGKCIASPSPTACVRRRCIPTFSAILQSGQFGGWYVDLDIILLGKELPRRKVYLARESENLVNGAVMTFPQGSPFIAAAIEEAWKLLPEAGPGAPLSKRISIGPELVTRLVREYALDHVVRPRSSAYEIGYDEIPAMFDPAHRSGARGTDRRQRFRPSLERNLGSRPPSQTLRTAGGELSRRPVPPVRDGLCR